MTNGRRNAVGKTMRLIVTLTILAWAMQLLLDHYGYGAEGTAEPRDKSTEQPAPQPEEKFVPGTPRFLSGATLELRGEATIVGGEVKLKQICRWADGDKSAVQTIADLLGARSAAGVAGSGSCRTAVARSNGNPNEIHPGRGASDQPLGASVALQHRRGARPGPRQHRVGCDHRHRKRKSKNNHQRQCPRLAGSAA